MLTQYLIFTDTIVHHSKTELSGAGYVKRSSYRTSLHENKDQMQVVRTDNADMRMVQSILAVRVTLGHGHSQHCTRSSSKETSGIDQET